MRRWPREAFPKITPVITYPEAAEELETMVAEADEDRAQVCFPGLSSRSGPPGAGGTGTVGSRP